MAAEAAVASPPSLEPEAAPPSPPPPPAPEAATPSPPALEIVDRKLWLLSGRSPAGSQLPGDSILELGPSHAPIAPKSAGWNTHVVDYTDEQGLLAKFAGDAAVDPSRIEEVDSIWAGQPLHQAVPAALHGSFNLLIASHVAEHLPDLIGFLQSAETLLSPAATIALAIPDRRFCFDYFKPGTLTGDVLEASLLQRRFHAPRSAWNHVAYSVDADGTGAWGQHPVRSFAFKDAIPRAVEAARRMAQPEPAVFEDFHCWHFTPASFRLVMLELGLIGAIDWHIEALHGPQGCEFLVRLRRGTGLGPDLAAYQTQRLMLLREVLIETRTQLDYLLDPAA